VECPAFVAQLRSLKLWEFAPQRLRLELTKYPASNARREKTKSTKELLANRHPVKAGDADGV
jgi:hypothetical protein